MIKNIKVRLNLDKEEHRRAYEILSHSGKSISQFVTAAVNRYGGDLSEEEEKERLLQEISETVRGTILQMFGAALTSGQAYPVMKKPEDSAEIAEESGAIADDFLENF